MKKLLLSICCLLLTIIVKAQTLDHTGAYITLWDSSKLPSYSIPLNNMTGASYYWEKVGEETTSNSGTDYTLSTSERVNLLISVNSGIYRLYVKGITKSPHSLSSNSAKYAALTAVESWGNIEWTSMYAFFYAAKNLNNIPTTAPNLTQVTDMSFMFSNATSFNQNISNWDVSKVTNMSYMFTAASAFNQNIGSWDVSKVTNMSSMFSNATSFNQNISNWDVSKVTDMSSMFINASAFNGNIRGWDVSNVTNMRNMFSGASAFNQNIGDWKLNSSMYSLENMLSNSGLNVDNYTLTLSGWAANVGTFTAQLRLGADNLKYGTITGEDFIAALTAKNITVTPAIYNKIVLAHTGAYITLWDSKDLIDNILSLGNMEGASYYWEKVGEETTTRSGIDYTLSTSAVANLPINKNTGIYKIYIKGITRSPHSLSPGQLTEVVSWGNVVWTDMSSFFQFASKLSILPAVAPNLTGITDMGNMFAYTTFFNQNIGNWNVSNVTDMNRMFFAASSFNQNIGNWDVSKVTNMSSMFSNANAFNQNIGNWNVSKVTNMSGMFATASTFNQNIGSWDVGEVVDMNNMFYYARNFNQNIGNWDISAVTNMNDMFYTASAFNQNIGAWKFNAGISFDEMLSLSGLSCENYSLTLKGWATNSNTLTNAKTLYAEGLKYASNAASYRTALAAKNINIIGDTEDPTCMVNLPVVLKSFTAKKINTGALLNWQTLSEQNNAYYVLERSTNGADFVPLTKLTALGNNGGIYSYTDNAPLAGTNYYRLSQVDTDGTITILGVQALTYDLLVANSMVLYPNPLRGNQLTVTLSSAPSKALALNIYNLVGQKVYGSTVNSQKQAIAVNLSKGVYLVEVLGYGIQKIIVQ